MTFLNFGDSCLFDSPTCCLRHAAARKSTFYGNPQNSRKTAGIYVEDYTGGNASEVLADACPAAAGVRFSGGSGVSRGES